MAKQTINIGSSANDGTGDQLRTAFDKTNDNFIELYNMTKASVPTTAVGSSGDVQGMIAANSTHVYICIADWDGSTDIWRRAAVATW